MIWNVSPTAAGFPSSPTNALAKSRACVNVQSDVPSPCTTVGTPRRIPDDPSGYARYTLDVRMVWIMLSGQDVLTAIPYTEA